MGRLDDEFAYYRALGLTGTLSNMRRAYEKGVLAGTIAPNAMGTITTGYNTGTGVDAEFVPVLNTVYFMPLDLPRKIVTTHLSIHVGIAQGATSVARLGIYRDSAGKPGALAVEATSTVNTNSATAQELACVATVAGRIWLACVVQTAAGTASVGALTGWSDKVATTSLALSGSNAGGAGYVQTATASGALPATATAVTVAPTVPRVSVKVA